MRFHGLSELSEASLARDFIVPSHQDLPLLRLFLPFDSVAGPFRWSAALPKGNELGASASWMETADPTMTPPSGCSAGGGRLDQATAAALIDRVGSLRLLSARWMGYADFREPKHGYRDGDYVIAPFDICELLAGERLPEFCWDEQHSFAWGGRLYPDSLIVAAAQPIFSGLASDARLDTVGIIGARDTLPLSSAD